MHYFARIETALTNPALEAFANQIAIGTELVVAQVLIRRDRSDAWELRHLEDRNMAGSALKSVALTALRELAQTTVDNAFRPLKSAPNLRRGWVATVHSVKELGSALDQLYPGFVADWFSARKSAPPITHYRDFTNRQTGMYRITQHLTDAQAAIRACCHIRFCLKQRLWTIPGQPVDSPGAKSLIPCLEPCAVMLEFARTAARIEQSPPVQISEDETTSIAAGVREAAELPSKIREADFSSPENPRRLQLAVEKLAPMPAVCD